MKAVYVLHPDTCACNLYMAYEEPYEVVEEDHEVVIGDERVTIFGPHLVHDERVDTTPFPVTWEEAEEIMAERRADPLYQGNTHVIPQPGPRICKAHHEMKLEHGDAHYEQVIGENQMKNVAVGLLMECDDFADEIHTRQGVVRELKIEHEIKVSFDADRKLVIEVTSADPGRVAEVLAGVSERLAEIRGEAVEASERVVVKGE